MKPRMGVCMVMGACYPDISGGATQAFNVMEGLKNEFDFHVIATNKTSSGPKPPVFKVYSRETLRGINIFRLNLIPGNLISEILTFIGLFCIFFRVKSRVDIFCMLGYTRKSCLIAVLARLFKKKLIIRTTSSGVDDPLSIRQGYLLPTLIYSRADAFIVTSLSQVDSFKSAGLSHEKMHFIPNGVDTEVFYPLSDREKEGLRKELGIPVHADVILSVGFFSGDKRIDLLAKSMSFLKPDKLKDLYIIFIGSKDIKEPEVSEKVIESVYNTIDALDLRSRVKFIEKTDHIDRYYKASDIFIFPSKREGLPNSLLEAMACGLCCIANRLKGTTDYIIEESRDGYLVDSERPEEIARVLDSAVSDRDTREAVGREARSKVVSKFDIKTTQDNYRRLYKQI